MIYFINYYNLSLSLLLAQKVYFAIKMIIFHVCITPILINFIVSIKIFKYIKYSFFEDSLKYID